MVPFMSTVPRGWVAFMLLWAVSLLISCSVLNRSSYPSNPPPPATAPGQPKPYRVNGAWYKPLSHSQGFEEQGIASWYGKDFHGRKTSNGEIYNMYAVSAAHKTLPLGTYVRVYNLNNGRKLDVRINDRGPFVKGRIIDLSYAAADALGVVGPGTAPVKIVALGEAVESKDAGGQRQYRPVDYYSGNFTFQVGAFTELANAQRLVEKLDPSYQNAHMTTFQDGGRLFYRVRVGHTNDLAEAEKYEKTLEADGFPGAFIVAE